MPPVQFASLPYPIIAAHLLLSLYNIVARGVLDLQPYFQKLCMTMDPFFMQLFLTFCQRLVHKCHISTIFPVYDM